MTRIVSASSTSSRSSAAALVQPHRWLSTSTSSTSNNNNEEEATTQTEEATTPPDAAETDEPATATISAEEQQQKQLLLHQEEIKSLKDQLLRSLAEQENIRAIARRDVQAGKSFAIKSFAKSLLEVSDNLTRALEASADQTQDNPQLDSLYQGVAMTNAGLTKALGANGVVHYCQLGDVFNPDKHEALMEYPDPTKEPGTVGQVIKVGYTLNDRVLRPAEVGVIKKA
jgi:molecular chaperone GrpE